MTQMLHLTRDMQDVDSEGTKVRDEGDEKDFWNVLVGVRKNVTTADIGITFSFLDE